MKIINGILPYLLVEGLVVLNNGKLKHKKYLVWLEDAHIGHALNVIIKQAVLGLYGTRLRSLTKR
jgi:hypothetical protein